MTTPRKESKRKPIEIIHFAVLHGGQLDLDGVRFRQSSVIEPTDVQERADGIRLASPWRLAFDLAADLPVEDLESVIGQIQSKSLCQFVTLATTARRLARPARPGSAAFVAALVGRLPGGPLESHPEVRLAKALHAAGIPIQLGTADRRRDRQCHLIGWQVDRVTAIEMLDLAAIVAELVDVYHARVAEVGQRTQ